MPAPARVAAGVVAVAAAAVLLAAPGAHAESHGVPEWVKANAGWWAEGTITDGDFLGGVGYLIGAGVIEVTATGGGAAGQGGAGAEAGGGGGPAVPEWVKTSAGWWAEGSITDEDFVGSLQYLINAGLIRVPAGGADDPEADAQAADDPAGMAAAGDGNDGGSGGYSPPADLLDELAACADIVRAYERLDCERDAEGAIEAHMYRSTATAYEAGPVVFYYQGLGTEGNDLFMEGDQAILTVRMLAENTGSENAVLSCTGPAICAYDVWDGSRAFKYSGMDFTNGQIVLKPGAYRVFNMLFGPNIGYGGTQFEYDSSREYTFRVSEPWGGADIPIS